jgi:hypothetical protein
LGDFSHLKNRSPGLPGFFYVVSEIEIFLIGDYLFMAYTIGNDKFYFDIPPKIGGNGDVA